MENHLPEETNNNNQDNSNTAKEKLSSESVPQEQAEGDDANSASPNSLPTSEEIPDNFDFTFIGPPNNYYKSIIYTTEKDVHWGLKVALAFSGIAALLTFFFWFPDINRLGPFPKLSVFGIAALLVIFLSFCLSVILQKATIEKQTWFIRYLQSFSLLGIFFVVVSEDISTIITRYVHNEKEVKLIFEDVKAIVVDSTNTKRFEPLDNFSLMMHYTEKGQPVDTTINQLMHDQPIALTLGSDVTSICYQVVKPGYVFYAIEQLHCNHITPNVESIPIKATLKKQ